MKLKYISIFHKITLIFSILICTFSFLKPIENANASYSTRVKFAENNPISDTMCKIYYTFTGTIAKSISVFVIVVTAFGFFLGKISWGIVISISVAIGLLFSGEKLLVSFVGPKASAGCQCKPGTFGFSTSCTARNTA